MSSGALAFIGQLGRFFDEVVFYGLSIRLLSCVSSPGCLVSRVLLSDYFPPTPLQVVRMYPVF